MKKYHYYKDKVVTVDDFIKYSATQSMMSGKKYKVHCHHASAQDSANGLSDELHRFRQSQSEKAYMGEGSFAIISA
ncbi:MAG: DUF5329 family protein [Mariprofundaceae bacterium]|nr:DUF5329 family protein [Mariprofundaceae bacterium]